MGRPQQASRRRNTGGIIGLLDYVEGNRQAVEFDLIKLGLRLRDVGSKRFTWEDLRAALVGIRSDPASSLARAVEGPDLQWTLTAQLIAAVYDQTQYSNYLLRRLAGDDKADLPEPLPRPGVKPTTVQWAGKAVTIEEMDRLLGWD